MAHMLPPELKDFVPASKEDIVFQALEMLPDDYYVFHSVSETVTTSRGQLFEREVDFLVVHPDKGLLSIECKAGDGIEYRNRNWYYTSGKMMDHQGPYHQVRTAMRSIRTKVEEHGNLDVRNLISKLRFFYAVCFIDMSEKYFDHFTNLPEEADKRLTIFYEDLQTASSIKNKIESIFELQQSWEAYITEDLRLSKNEFQLLLDFVLCPHCNLIPAPGLKNKFAKDHMIQLLREQYRLLDFLEEQYCAVINGAAGTGKTMIAVEKARRHSKNGESVLFLCFNSLLRDYLEEEHKRSSNKELAKEFENVDFYTISKLAKEMTGNMKDFDGLNLALDNCLYGDKEFKYQHIIIDEGQDFAIVDSDLSSDEASSNVSIINTLQELAEERNGTFYLFYDEYQMIQGTDSKDYELPRCIRKADCKLTLRTNCRNTEAIAKTSMTPLKDDKNRAIKPQTAKSIHTPAKPVLHLLNDEEDMETVLQTILYKYKQAGIEQVTIITPGSVKSSSLAMCFSEGTGSNSKYHVYNYMNKDYRVTTSRKFKGLQSEAVVVIDLDKDSFIGTSGKRFYVGSSRAELRLDMICVLQPEDYYPVAHSLDPNIHDFSSNPKKMKNVLSSVFNANIEQ